VFRCYVLGRGAAAGISPSARALSRRVACSAARVYSAEEEVAGAERSRVFGCVRDGEAGETSSFINKMAGALPVDNRGWVGSDRARFAGVWQARLIGGRVERARMIDDLLSFFLVPVRRRFARCPPWAMGPATLVARHVMFVWASHSSPSMEILRQ
jgi:hypothetical protein